MNSYMLLSYGFKKPTPEEMGEWQKWFGMLGERIVGSGHLPKGHEFSADGSRELSLSPEGVTGYCVFKAESLEEAKELASQCPYVHKNQVFEIFKPS